MTDTAIYTNRRVAFMRAAETFGCRALGARIALAVSDRGGKATTHELAYDLRVDSSDVRRELTRLYAAGLANGVGSDGGKRRQGVVTEVTLTDRGRALVKAFFAHLDRADRTLRAAA